MFCGYTEDKDNVAKANQHFGHVYGHGFYGMHISPMREAMEKPKTYLQPIMEGAKVIAELGCVLVSTASICRNLLKGSTVLMPAPKR